MLYRADPSADLTAAEGAVLQQGGFSLESADLGSEDPLAQGAAEFAALLKGSLTTAAAAERLGVDPSRIRRRLTGQPRTLLGIRLDSGWVVPEFQFDGFKLLPGIAEVVSRLDPELHPVAVLRWFTMPNSDLTTARDAKGLIPRALSPCDWLRFGFSVRTVADMAADL